MSAASSRLRREGRSWYLGDELDLLYARTMAIPAGYGQIRYAAGPERVLYYGLVLLGVFLVVRGISGLSSLPVSLYSYDSELKSFVVGDSWWVVASATVVATLLLGVMPGVLLVRYAPSIAARFTREEPVEAFGFSDAGLYLVAFLFLAVFFLVSGLGNLISGVLQSFPIVSEFGFDRFSMYAAGLGALGRGTVELVAAVMLYYHSLRAV